MEKDRIIPLPGEITAVLDIFASAGVRAYIVGGAVRDSLMHRPVHDFDIASPMLPEATAALFTERGFRVIPTGIKHGTVTVLSGDMPVEVTAFRFDGSYTDGRHPDSVKFTSRIEDDLSRRDFTVNAMAYSPQSGLCDPFGGEGDLHAGIIRCVGDARVRFTEDALRILRAFRFAAVLGFEIDPSVLAAARELSERLSLISAERIASETVKMMLAGQPSAYLASALECGVLGYVFRGVELRASDFSVADRLPADAPLKIGAVLRRAGLSGPAVVGSALEALRFSNTFYRRAYAAATVPLPVCEPAPVRRFLRETGNADAAIAAAVACGEPHAAGVAELAREIGAEGGPVTMQTLAVNGKKLRMAGFPAGREMGRLLGALLDAVTADPSLNDEATLMALARSIYEKNTERKDI